MSKISSESYGSMAGMSSTEQPSDRREGRHLHTAALRIRPTVGLIVLDDTQRVLLFKVQDAVAIDIARPDVTLWWGSPGRRR
jgi:hypothetical protein